MYSSSAAAAQGQTPMSSSVPSSQSTLLLAAFMTVRKDSISKHGTER